MGEPVLSLEDETDWHSYIETALTAMGGEPVSLSEINDHVHRSRRTSRKTPPGKANLRKWLEEHSSDSKRYKNGPDLYSMPYGQGSEVFGLRKPFNDGPWQPPKETRPDPVLVGDRIKVFKGKEIIKETDGVSVDGKLYSGLFAAESAISASQSE